MRYLKISLLLGAIACAVALALYETGVYERADRALWELLGGVTSLPGKQLWYQYALVVFVGFAVTWTTVDIPRLSLKSLVAVGALLNVISATWVLNFYYLFFSPFPLISVVVLAFVFGLAYARSEAGRRKAKLRLLFGDRLSRRTFYQLVNDREKLEFTGQLREASVLVCEVFNHEELMDALPVEDYVAMTNLFLHSASEFLVERGGYLDECDGESLRVIFGAPLADPEHAVRACEAALELSLRLENLNRECETRWHRTLDHRIGLNSGEVVAAAFGSGRLGTFSVAGETVELARRLCSANLRYGSRLLVGPETLGETESHIEVRPMDLVRGRDERTWVEVYELLGLKNSLSAEEAERRDAFWRAVIFSREERWEDALDHFQLATPADKTDAPLEFHLERVRQMRSGLASGHTWSMARA